MNFIDSVGTISYLDSTNTQFSLEGFSHYKPAKLSFGISYKPKSNSDLTVSAEIQSNQINNQDNQVRPA